MSIRIRIKAIDHPANDIIKHFVNDWYLKCNPFWIDKLTNFRAEKMFEYADFFPLIEGFINLQAELKKVVVIYEEDLMMLLEDAHIKRAIVDKALEKGIIVKVGDGYRLSDMILRVLYSVPEKPSTR